MGNTASKPWGEIFMVGLPGPDLDDGTRELIHIYGVNNFILFKRNVVDPLQLAKLCTDLKNACHERGVLQPLISIDQEGGRVARLGPPFTIFGGASAIARAAYPEEEACRFARITAEELNLIGCNMDLAPVLDLESPEADAVMEGRTFGNDPGTVGHLGGIIVKGLQERGILATAKHFPGIGGVRLDPHRELPVIKTPLEDFESTALKPFQMAISAGVAAVMTAHVIYPDLDPEFPATLSGSILCGLLRKRMGFDGLIIADDLEMGAIENNFSLERSIMQAFMAGVDILLMCHSKNKVIRAIESLETAAEGDEKGRARLEESLGRIRAAKEKVGILDTVAKLNETAIRDYFGIQT